MQDGSRKLRVNKKVAVTQIECFRLASISLSLPCALLERIEVGKFLVDHRGLSANLSAVFLAEGGCASGAEPRSQYSDDEAGKTGRKTKRILWITGDSNPEPTD